MAARIRRTLCVSCCLALLAWPELASAQIGQSKRDVSGKAGVYRQYFPQDSQFEWYYSESTLADPVRRSYAVHGDRVAGLALQWPNKELTLDEALRELNNVTGLPAFQPAPKKPTWQFDGHQLAAFPPIGAWESRPLRVPVFSVVSGARAQWTEYYDKWGKFLGQSPAQVTPIVSTYSRYVGAYQFQVTKLPLPLVRGDRSAYAWLELADHSRQGGFATCRLFVAEPEVYWRSRLEDFRKAASFWDHTPDTFQRQPPSLDQLRPYDLEVTDSYDRALLDHVPRDFGAVILAGWRINTVVGAIDDERVPLAAVQDMASQCPSKELCEALLKRLRNRSVEQIVRRAELLDSLGSYRWASELSGLMQDKEKGEQITSTMRKLAARHGVTDAELEAMGATRSRWEKWYREQKTLAKK